MEQNEAMETSAVMMESTQEAGAVPDGSDEVMAAWQAEARELREVYPQFDLQAELEHPVLGALLRGEGRPTLRQLYEAVHLEDISAERISAAVESAVAERVEAAVAAAVAEAVREGEARLLDSIRARGQRPLENGVRAAVGIRMHPAVDRLTRRERAMLAKRAEMGETIKL